MSRRPVVELEGGDEASGLASMLAEVVRDNIGDYRGRASVARRARGAVVLTASDRQLSVTLRFDAGTVTVSDGPSAGAPELAGPWLTMAGLCSGQVSPLAALRRRELAVVPGRPLSVLPAAAYVLSVPASYYRQAEGEGAAQRRRIVWLAAGLVVALLVASLWWRARRAVT